MIRDDVRRRRTLEGVRLADIEQQMQERWDAITQAEDEGRPHAELECLSDAYLQAPDDYTVKQREESEAAL